MCFMLFVRFKKDGCMDQILQQNMKRKPRTHVVEGRKAREEAPVGHFIGINTERPREYSSLSSLTTAENRFFQIYRSIVLDWRCSTCESPDLASDGRTRRREGNESQADAGGSK